MYHALIQGDSEKLSYLYFLSFYEKCSDTSIFILAYGKFMKTGLLQNKFHFFFQMWTFIKLESLCIIKRGTWNILKI
jgi:hypothetical protein